MTEDDEDPFERLGDVDREGDPFERLDDADEPPETDDVSGPDETPSATGGPDKSDQPEVDPFADFEREAGVGDTASGGEPPTVESETDAGATPTDPFSGVDRQTDDPFAGMDEQAGDPFGGGDSVFERVDVGEVDADDVWSSLTDDDGGEDDGPVIPDEGRHAEVSKHTFCEQCEYFAEPPDAHCTHETAEIIEYLDMERVRLRDCPVVAERKELED